MCNVLLICQSNHDIQLLKLDVNWIIVLDKEHFHLILKDVSPEKKQNKTTVSNMKEVEKEGKREIGLTFWSQMTT